jgi:fatty-acyl-CoA synthase
MRENSRVIDGTMQTFALTLDKFLSHAAKWHPEVEVVTARADGAADRIGYAALKTRALRLSAMLAGLGVKFGDRVATLAWNTQAHLETWYGVMGMGAVCHTLNPRLTAGHLAEMLRQSKARILLLSADLMPLARQISDHATSLTHIFIIDGETQEWQAQRTCITVSGLEPAIAAATGEVTWGDFDEVSPSGLCFTSGTTGAPKGVTYTHRSSYLHTLRMLQADMIGLTAADAVLAVVPMFHANAWGLSFAAPAAGARLILPGRHAQGADLARLIAAEGVTIAVGVPTVWLGLLAHMEAAGGSLPSLQRILVGGAPMPPALMARLERELGVTVQTSWGMTELSPSGTISSPHDPDRTAQKSGRPAVGVDLLLTDATGKPLAAQRDAEGHLRVRGAAVVAHYFGKETSALDAAGWFDTGDLARIDTTGNLRITGRAKDLIKSGGEWINPAEIEVFVGALAQISHAAVIGRPDAKWGERPILVVETRPDFTISDQELLEALRGRVASWWIPDLVVRVAAMPMAATGKIDKIRLRQEYGQG